MTRAKSAKPDVISDGTDSIVTFEASLARLHAIVEHLEGRDLDLEESLRLFEEGVRLSRTSQARLNAAEKRVEELLAIDDDENPVVRELSTST